MKLIILITLQFIRPNSWSVEAFGPVVQNQELPPLPAYLGKPDGKEPLLSGDSGSQGDLPPPGYPGSVEDTLLPKYPGKSVDPPSKSRPGNPDIYLSTPELIQKYGFPFESHEVTTKDFAKLTLFRIPHGRAEHQKLKNDPDTKLPKRHGVVYLHHGIGGAAGYWIMNFPEKALAYMLADEGYDVWLANARGSDVSQGHEHLTAEDPKYWDYGLDEMSYFDIPAAIDFILEITDEPQLFYIGHSMGTNLFFNAMIQHPEYNSKIRLMIALAPVAFLGQIPYTFLRLLATTVKGNEHILYRWFGFKYGSSESIQRHLPLIGRFCNLPVLQQSLCNNIFYIQYGQNRAQTDPTWAPVIMTHGSNTLSTKAFVHYIQLINSGKWTHYDYGREDCKFTFTGNVCVNKNEEHYHQSTPKEYDPRKITAPVLLIGGQSDKLATPEDVEKLSKLLPNLVELRQVNYPAFTHNDFIWAKDADTLVYNGVIDAMKAGPYPVLPQPLDDPILPDSDVADQNQGLLRDSSIEPLLQTPHQEPEPPVPSHGGGVFQALRARLTRKKSHHRHMGHKLK